MKFGINTLLYTATFRDENVSSLFSKFASIGFDGVEIALEKKGDLDYKKTLKAYKENNLECSSVCGMFGEDRDLRGPNKEYIENGISYVKDCIDACTALECKLFCGPLYSSVGRADLVPDEEKKIQWETCVDSLRRVCDYSERSGVYIAIEPLNRFETDFINICEDAIKLIKAVGSKMLKIHLDTFHMNIEEKSSATAILNAAELLYMLHTSENDRGTPGTGQVNWESIADSLRRIGYNGWVVIESFTPENKIIAKAASVWRKTEENEFLLAERGLSFLRRLLV